MTGALIQACWVLHVLNEAPNSCIVKLNQLECRFRIVIYWWTMFHLNVLRSIHCILSICIPHLKSIWKWTMQWNFPEGTEAKFSFPKDFSRVFEDVPLWAKTVLSNSQCLTCFSCHTLFKRLWRCKVRSYRLHGPMLWGGQLMVDGWFGFLNPKPPTQRNN